MSVAILWYHSHVYIFGIDGTKERQLEVLEELMFLFFMPLSPLVHYISFGKINYGYIVDQFLGHVLIQNDSKNVDEKHNFDAKQNGGVFFHE